MGEARCDAAGVGAAEGSSSGGAGSGESSWSKWEELDECGEAESECESSRCSSWGSSTVSEECGDEGTEAWLTTALLCAVPVELAPDPPDCRLTTRTIVRLDSESVDETNEADAAVAAGGDELAAATASFLLSDIECS